MKTIQRNPSCQYYSLTPKCEYKSTRYYHHSTFDNRKILFPFSILKDYCTFNTIRNNRSYATTYYG